MPAPVHELSRLARGWRAVLLAGLAVLFCLGSVVGQDDWWPFSPWRMFSTSTPTTGSVVAMAIEVRTDADPTWRDAALSPSSIGLNRAEVEGRTDRVAAAPSMLGTLAVSHRRLRPQEPVWTAVRLVRRETLLVDRRPTGEVRSTEICRWTAR